MSETPQGRAVQAAMDALSGSFDRAMSQTDPRDARIAELEAVLREAHYILANNELAGDVTAGKLATQITELLNKGSDTNG